MNGYKNLRSKSTGKTGTYPASFLTLFDDFEEYDPASEQCVDCVVNPDKHSDAPEAEPVDPTPIRLVEPAPAVLDIPRPRKSDKTDS